ncbi:MAG: hypothetical protein CV087_09900 [Candidatus Brocadia sp. WS118]|nr:MAG: hypothetical protein CV087_09900 [Candidatus Brocadia sp. WS118]
MKKEQKNEFLELRAKGMSYDKIARELGVSKQTLINWSKELETELINLRVIEMEALREKYLITSQTQIELLGTQLKKVREELEKRDLSEIPTLKLFDLFMKYYKLLDEESKGVSFRTVKENKYGRTDTDYWYG